MIQTGRAGGYETKKADRPAHSPAMDVLLACLRADCDPAFSGIPEAACQGVDWSEFVQLCACHYVYPTVWEVLRKTDGLVPGEVLSVLGDRTRQNTLRGMTLSAELVRLDGILGRNGLRMLPLKGPALARQAYGNTCRRVSCDLDLLVEPDQRERVMDVLLEEGYRCVDPDLTPKQQRILQNQGHCEHYYLANPKIEIDLHWTLSQENYCRIAFEDLWNEASTVEIDGNPVRVLARETSLLYLSAHGAKHHWSQLRYLFDILKVKALLTGADWPRVADDIERLRLEHIIGQTMRLSDFYLPADWPEEIRRYAGGRRARTLVSTAMLITNISAGEDDGRPETSWKLGLYKLRYKWLLSRDWPERIATLLRCFRPNERDYRAIRLPDRLHFLYYLLRPFTVMLRKAGILRGRVAS